MEEGVKLRTKYEYYEYRAANEDDLRICSAEIGLLYPIKVRFTRFTKLCFASGGWSKIALEQKWNRLFNRLFPNNQEHKVLNMTLNKIEGCRPYR